MLQDTVWNEYVLNGTALVAIMWNNVSFPLPLPLALLCSLSLHHPNLLCVVLSGFPHSTALVLSCPISGRICIDFQPPVPGALLLRGLPAPFLLLCTSSLP